MENSSPPPDRLLYLIKTRGPQTAAMLGTALGVTPEAARQQLVRMAAEGLVEAESVARGVGRPARVYRLTAAGHARFPDAHAELTLRLLHTVRTEFGAAGLDRVIEARGRESLAKYEAALAGARTAADRVARLAAERSAEGYMAEVVEEDGCCLLVENHCPICAAATACQGFCRSELDVFRAVLGPDVTVERVEHVVAGDRRCAYRITPAERPAAGLRSPRRRGA